MKPSTCDDRPWIYARGEGGTTQNTGKWLLFLPFAQIDEWWEKIEKALADGLLGPAAKVSTHRTNGEGEYVICVYTRDWTDEADVMRVRDALRELGVTWPIGYKTDEATRAGRYAQAGQRVCRWRI